jgi:DNA polymerase III delta prime subunit
VNYSTARRPRLVPAYLPPSGITLYPHQDQGVRELAQHWANGHKRVLFYGPPGSGKTSVMAWLCRQAYNRGEKTTILVPMNCAVTKSQSDLTQICGALMRVGLAGLFGVRCGEFPALVNDAAPIQIVTMQSLTPALHELLKDTDRLLIDEGHTASFFAKAQAVYKDWAWKSVTNFTGSPHNRSQGRDDRHGDLERNTAIVAMPSYRVLEQGGYLSPLRYHSIQQQGDIDLNSAEAIRWILQQWIKHCADLGLPTTHAVGFTKPRKGDKRQAELIQSIGAELGLSFTIVGDDCSQRDYELAMDAFEAGDTSLLCVQALSTAWDCALVRHVMLWRAIGSRDRYVQAATRCDRVHLDKPFGEIWDFAGNVQLAGEDSGLHPKIEDLSEMVNSSVLAPKARAAGEAPTKACCKCEARILAAAVECPHCGAIQPPKSMVFAAPNGQLLTEIPESMARDSAAGLAAYFRYWRVIAFAKGWSPFTAVLKCKATGAEVAESAPFWQGSTGVSREAYQAHLLRHQKVWGWSDSQCRSEMAREFGRVES